MPPRKAPERNGQALKHLERERDAIRRAREEWMRTVDAVREPMMVHDAECRIVRANRAYAERAGMGFKELIGRRYWECFPRGAGPLSGCGPAELAGAAAGASGVPEHEFALASGEVFISRVFVVSHGAGGSPHVQHLFENVTERRRADRALRRGLEATVEAIAVTVETRDPYTAGHQRRVASLARGIGEEMGLPEPMLDGLRFGALIHDLGKIQIPAEILAKPARLMPVEFALIKTHPQAGYDIVKGIEFPWPVRDMVLQHHEHLDGSGYPQGLKGDAIAPEARILAVADTVEAMASHRPYRASLGIDSALQEVAGKRGTWFDAAAVDACVRLFRERGYSLEAGLPTALARITLP